MTDKIFCGNGKQIQTQYGPLMKLSFSATDLEKLQQNLDNGWVNAVVKEKREKVEGKPTHYLEVDTWKPDPNRQQEPAPEVNGNGNPDDSEPLPF